MSNFFATVEQLRDRRFDSSLQNLDATPYKALLNEQMARGLEAILMLFIAAGMLLWYGKHYRPDFLLFMGVQWYLLLVAIVLFLPFCLKLFHPKADVRNKALLTFRHPESRLLRLLAIVVSMYVLIGLTEYAASFIELNDPFNWDNLRFPTFENYLDAAYRISALRFYGSWLGASLLVFLGLEAIDFYLRSQRKKHYRTTRAMHYYPFSAWLGQSTGELVKVSHGAGIPAGKQISLGWRDATQNIIILGGTGSGKTTQSIHPILLQLLDQQCGGLIFDIKSNFIKAVEAFAHATGREQQLMRIGPGFLSINLIEGLTPEMAASFLKSSLMLSGLPDVNTFFTDTATELCRNALGILSFIPEHYSLHGLYNYIFDASFQKELHKQIEALLSLETLTPEQVRLLQSYRQYREQIFDKFEDKLKSGVLASVAQILSPFNHPGLIDAFCKSTDCRLEQVLEGGIFLVQLPLSVWGLGGKVADNFIKLRFFNVMQQREIRSDWNQNRLVFFVCDEYQEIVSANKDGLSDLNFWDKSRSSKTIGIISSQSIKSFYAAIGDRDCADAILQNFRQKLCFRTEDQATLDYLNRLTGRVEVEKISISQQSGSSSSSKHSGSHRSKTKTISKVDRNVMDPQMIRNLKPTQAVALLVIDGYSRDDVLDMMTIYV